MPLLKAPTRSFVQSTAFERFVGGLAATPFIVIYFVAPLYLFFALALLAVQPFALSSYVVLLPIIVSVLTPPSVAVFLSPLVLCSWACRQMPKYFHYEEYHELQDKEMMEGHTSGKRYILVSHPHGVFSFTGVCGAIATMSSPDGVGRKLAATIPTAAATVIRTFPLLKDLLGVFGVIDAAGPVLKKRLSSKGGSFVLYVGGIAELFETSAERECCYLLQRKGFIKLAIRAGADVVPAYFFGNTAVLSVLSSGPLATLSRKLGMSLTLTWGLWGLPVPKPVKLVYARGRPLGLPHIPEPTDAEVEEWHGKYVAQLKKLFDDYKHTHPLYADKELLFK
jgi:2-acylglycerol O-acyltransferase 2